MEAWSTTDTCIAVAIGLMVIFTAWSLFVDKNIVYTYPPSTLDKDVKEGIMGTYYLPETVLDIKVTVKVKVAFDANDQVVDTKIIEHSFITTPTTLPDVSTAYSLYYKSNPLANDEVAYVVNESGLLESLEAVSDSQTAKIISSLIHAPGTALKNAAAAAAAFPRVQAPQRVEIKEFTKDFRIYAWDTVNNPTLIDWKIPVVAGGPIVNSDFTINSKVTALGKKPSAASTDEREAGLIFRGKIPASIEITIPGTNPLVAIQNGLVYFSKALVFTVPIRNGAFVRRKHSLKMSKGELISHSVENPSSVLGFINIPIDVLKAIVSIPAQLISFRIDTVTKKKDLEVAQNSLTDEMIKSKDLAKKLQGIKDTEEQIKDLEQKNKAEKLKDATEIQKLKASLDQSKLDRALAAQGFERKVKQLEDRIKDLELKK